MRTLAVLTVLVSSLCQPALAQSETTTEAKVILDRLSTLPKPKAQPDLDTVQLASANRERAASVDEKTNGLWQSWVVSICQGCTPDQRRPSEIEKAVEAYRPDFSKAPSDGRTPVQETGNRSHTGGAQQIPRGNLYTDLSSENIRQIRAMPNQ